MYVDGFVTPVPEKNRQRYAEVARQSASLFEEYGATRFVECWGDDVPEGERTDFGRAVALEAGEVAVFSWIEWPSKEVRDAGIKKMMEDPRMKALEMPFDGKRMIFGGFSPIVDARAFEPPPRVAR